jgi:predicted nucleotidyltransferase
MAVDYETVIQTARSYASEAKKALPVSKAVLFGSYAKGNPTKWSDIDVCFFLDSYGGKDRVDIIKELLLIAYRYDEYFEPTVFETLDLYEDNPFVKEVLRTGVDIL